MKSPNHVTKEDTTGGLGAAASELLHRNHPVIIGLVHHAFREDQLVQPVEICLQQADCTHLLWIDVAEFFLKQNSQRRASSIHGNTIFSSQ
jgi:hypothetical protein